MAVKLAFNELPQFIDGNGDPYAGGFLFTYTAGSSTKATTYQDSAGVTPNTNPIVLDANGRVPYAIWLTTGVSYKFVLAPSTDTDPPTSPVWTLDNVTGINDSTVTVDQWVSGATPTYVSATSFTLVGDQTSTYHVGRRLKTTNSGGTVYSTISASAFGASTTVTVVNDSGSLDSGLSAVSYGLLSATNPSTPLLTDAYPLVSGSSDKTKKVRLEADNLTTATTRVLTVPDFDQWLGANYSEMNARLTLTSGTPVTTGDVTAAETIYLTPFKGNRIWLYNGTLWQPYVLTEISADVPDATQMNDVFVYDNAGTLTLDVTAWTNDTTRATALTTQNGILVKTGSTSRRYVGSFYSTTAGNGQTELSSAKCYVWNYYNRVKRFAANATETANSWNYTTATYRQANANAANQFEYVQGVSEDIVEAEVLASVLNDGGNYANVGIGIDSTSANSAQYMQGHTSTNTRSITTARYQGYPGVGRHTVVWLEQSVAAGTTTWYGDNNTPTTLQSGILGRIWS